jgi:predicted O-methyltransferase YrrM
MEEDNRISVFIQSLEREKPCYLEQMERYATAEKVPIIRKETQSLLRFLVSLKRPKTILEVGTAIGFSALFMSEYAPFDCHITTIDKYEKWIKIAKENFHKQGQEGRITLLEGDAADLLGQLSGTFDLIFLDAAKGQYIHFLPELLRLLPEGGLLISDNCLQNGDILESRFAITRRDRTIHSRMREYLYTVMHHSQLESCILPIGDGVVLSTKREVKRCEAKGCETKGCEADGEGKGA